ncbi:hypothetical protein M0R45_026274 [Rubus argutus]|uniref:Uncharacterized protein n=1 Tax=Rubus argutus TaxID=59490 RepID=A0AAW1WX44_RUBAR
MDANETSIQEEVGMFWVETYSQAAKVMRTLMRACKQPRGLTYVCADASVQDAKGNWLVKACWLVAVGQLSHSSFGQLEAAAATTLLYKPKSVNVGGRVGVLGKHTSCARQGWQTIVAKVVTILSREIARRMGHVIMPRSKAGFCPSKRGRSFASPIKGIVGMLIVKKLVVGPWVGSTGPPFGVHRSFVPSTGNTLVALIGQAVPPRSSSRSRTSSRFSRSCMFLSSIHDLSVGTEALTSSAVKDGGLNAGGLAGRFPSVLCISSHYVDAPSKSLYTK